jgi:hypothetical protein
MLPGQDFKNVLNPPQKPRNNTSMKIKAPMAGIHGNGG